MIAQAMSEILPVSSLKDVLIYPNEGDQNNPKVRLVGAGVGKKIVDKARLEARSQEDNLRLISLIFPIAWLLLGFVVWRLGWVSDVIYAATLLVGVVLFIGFALGSQIKSKSTAVIPKLLVDNAGKKIAPFAEATGARAGALLGDVRHDPLQSGGLGTPAHLRVEPGMIHRVSGGVLFVDEIATLSPKSQQELLTAMQEKKYSITGQSEMSSGAMTRTDPIPCFPPQTVLSNIRGNTSIGDFVDSVLSKNKEKVNLVDGVETFDLIDEETTLAYLDEKIIPSKIQRVYRRQYSGKILKIKFDDGTQLVATPDHPIKTIEEFVKAKYLKIKDEVEVKKEFEIITEMAIVNTYGKENQRIAKAFNSWRASKKKLSAKELSVDNKTVYLWKKGTIPHALKSVNQLVQKKLLPLDFGDLRLPIIARIAGALFGDGGIDGRRFSKLYFSAGSNSPEDLEEFKQDILSIFGKDVESTITIRKSTSNTGSGLELSVNSSFIARFFYALGVPKGDKVSQSFSVPFWVKQSDKLEKEFFSSLLTCELYGNIRSSQDTPSFVMAKLKKFEKEHINFLNEIRTFLLKNKVKVQEVKQGKEYLKTKGLLVPELAGIYLFNINSFYKNILQLTKTVNFYYAKNKRDSMLDAGKRAKIFVKYKKHFDNKKKEALILRKKGMTIRAIAKKTRLDRNTVWKLVDKTYNKYSNADKNKVFDLLDGKTTPKTIAKLLEIPYTTVLYWKNNYLGGY